MPLEGKPQAFSPLVSVWLRPLDTIGRIVAEQRFGAVLPLAILSGAAGLASVLMGFGIGGGLLDWRALAICLVAGGALGIFNVYFYALLAGWIGRKLGGEASRPALRAAFAWGGLPTVLGLAAVLAILGTLRWVAAPDKAAVSQGAQVIFGVCALWSALVTLLMVARVERFGFWRAIVTYGGGALIASMLLAYTVRTVLFQPFNVPAASMMPTLLVGDYFFVSKYAYGYSRYSLPFSPPLFSGRIFGAGPERGDVVVFRLPKDPATDYVKRVVGLPGDRIQMKEGLLYINDVPVARERLPDFVSAEACGLDETAKVKRWRETLPNGASYETLDCVDNGFFDNTNLYTVPLGQYFVMGDNRDNSTDSRVQSSVGYVPLENMIGRVGLIFFSRGNGAQPFVRSERIGKIVH